MRVGIVGLGLIGGSLGLAVRGLRHSIDVTGVARRAESAAAAIQRGAVDRASTDLANLSDCDIVVIATPIDLRHLVKIDKPAFRAFYDLEEDAGSPTIEDVLKSVL